MLFLDPLCLALSKCSTNLSEWVYFLKVKRNVGSGHTEPFHLNDSEMHPGESVFPLQRPPFLLHSVKLLQLCPLFPQLPPSTKPFQEAQSELNQAAADLNQSAGDVVHATRGQSGELAAASGKFSDDFDEFLDAGIEMAGQAQVRGRGLPSGADPCLSPLVDCRPPRLSGK